MKRLACPKCFSRNYYTNKNTRVCRKCGYVGDKAEWETYHKWNEDKRQLAKIKIQNGKGG